MDACLSEHDLDALVRGSAEAEERQRCHRHLEICRACRTRLADKQAQLAGSRRHPRAGPVPSLDAAVGSPPTGEETAERLVEDSLPPGVCLGDFLIEKPLGVGGMGVVYRARQLSLNRQVALKVIRRGLGMTTGALQRFHREARAAARLHHTNIVAVYAEGEDHGICHYAMELIEGQSLAQIIAAIRASDASGSAADDATVPLDAPEPAKAEPTPSTDRLSASGLSGSGSGREHFDSVAKLIADVADALDYAHTQGVIHRDIKPSNLMLDRDGRLKLMDFGLARVLEEPGMTISGEFLGTPRYMSPEQIAAGRMKVDHRTDVYSLGATLYELLTLRPPFRGRHRDEIIAQIITKEPPRPRRLERRIPLDLETICLKALEKDPDRRYQTAGKMAEDLHRYVNRFAIEAKRVGPLGRLAKFVRRNKLPVAAAVMIVVLAAVAGVMTWQYRAGQKKLQAEQQQRLQLRGEAEAERCLWAAQKLHAEGRYQDALIQVEASLDHNPDRLEARLLHARLLFERERGGEALAELERLLGEPLHDADAGAVHFLLATIHQGSDQAKAEEHRQRAEKLLPETADAFYLRAMTAQRLEDTMRWLDHAMRLDPSHYPSVRARVLAYYRLGDYANMGREADRAISLRPRDASAWSLRASALRGMGSLDKAMADHDRALQLDPNDAEAHDQRRATERLMGNFRAALADAEECARLRPEDINYQFELFGALLLLGDTEAAARQYTHVVRSKARDKLRFDRWAKRFVFDALARGQPLQLPADPAPGTVFGAMQEAADFHRSLRTKAARVVAVGFRPSWSPDGTELAYSYGVPGSNAIQIMDLKSGHSRVVAVPGKNPAWSPDGEYIAFVRERQAQPITAVTVPREVSGANLEEEVWIITPAGTKARRLAKGTWPSWGRDSRRIFFKTRGESVLCVIPIDSPGAAPTPVMLCEGRFPAVSPDERYVAYTVDEELRIVRLQTGEPMASWRAPMSPGFLIPAWSPDGREVSVGGDPIPGLWVFDIERKTARQVFEGPVCLGVWSPDRSRLAIDVRGDYFEIWLANLDPKLPTTQALAPVLTPQEYLEETRKKLVAKYTRIIQSDAHDFHAYVQRGEGYAGLARWNEAVVDYTQAIRTRPPDGVRAYRLRAEAYVELNEYEKAAADYDAYRKLLEAGTFPAVAYNNLAWTYVTGPSQIRDAEKALPLAQRAVQLEPNNSNWLNTLGVVYYRLGRFEEAIKTLLRGVEGSGEGGTAFDFFFLAMSYEKLGQSEKAKEAYNKAVKRKPLSGQWTEELAAFRAEADLVLGKR